MDDFPAGPASSGPRRPPLSVVIPVRDGGRSFERCLRALRDSSFTDYELIVVDDGSTDGSQDLARSFGATVLRNETALGPAAARNRGATEAAAPVVFFIDADVALHRDTLAQALRRFEADPGLTALFGSYDDDPGAPGVASQYRNLLHHYVHQQGDFNDHVRPAHTFWTGCGAIRREAFLEVGGFDRERYRRPAIEDIELGYRLSEKGHRIVLARDVQATHLKRWTVRQILQTDIFQRGVPWMLLMLRSRVAENDLNVSQGQRLSVAATGLGIMGLAAAVVFPIASLLFVAGLFAQAVANRQFYAFLARRRGWRFAAASFPLHYLYFCCCGVSVFLAFAFACLPANRGVGESSGSKIRIDAAISTQAPSHKPARSRRRPQWTRR